jgi:hypothetical protein
MTSMADAAYGKALGEVREDNTAQADAVNGEVHDR